LRYLYRTDNPENSALSTPVAQQLFSPETQSAPGAFHVQVSFKVDTSVQQQGSDVPSYSPSIVWWEEVEWLQETTTAGQGNEARQGARNNQTTKQKDQAHQRGPRTDSMPLRRACTPKLPKAPTTRALGRSQGPHARSAHHNSPPFQGR
jgi:hypothetical protein